MTLGDRNLNVHSVPTDVCEHQLPSTDKESSSVNVQHMNTKANSSDSTLSDSCDLSNASSKSIETCLSHNESKIDEFVDVESAVHRLSRMLAQDCNTDCFILDIDLDFFSTINPFLSSRTAQQYQLLLQLYAYTPPSDRSTEVHYIIFLSVKCYV